MSGEEVSKNIQKTKNFFQSRSIDFRFRLVSAYFFLPSHVGVGLRQLSFNAESNKPKINPLIPSSLLVLLTDSQPQRRSLCGASLAVIGGTGLTKVVRGIKQSGARLKG